MASPDFTAARANMVEGQIRTNKVIDPTVIEAFSMVERETFIPVSHQALAYADEDVVVSNDVFFMEPYPMARLLEAANLQVDEDALIIACDEGLAAAYATYTQATISTQPTSTTQYDVVCAFGAVATIQDVWLEALKDGGRLITVLRPDALSNGVAMLIQKVGANISKRPLFDVSCPYFPGQEPKASFTL